MYHIRWPSLRPTGRTAERFLGDHSERGQAQRQILVARTDCSHFFVCDYLTEILTDPISCPKAAFTTPFKIYS